MGLKPVCCFCACRKTASVSSGSAHGPIETCLAAFREEVEFGPRFLLFLANGLPILHVCGKGLLVVDLSKA